MPQFKRIIDANLSRLGEGLRVIEDALRFELSNAALVNKCKALRNQVKTATQTFNYIELINSRSTGTDVRSHSVVPIRSTLIDLLMANIKRSTEACRSLEEATPEPIFTKLRYGIYELEQQIYQALQRQPLLGPGIYVVSDDPNHLLAMAKKPFVPIVQYRAKENNKSEIFTTCHHLAKEMKSLDVLFMINDYVDIAIDIDADGVHLGQDDIPTPAVRRQLGTTKLIGRTTHTFAQGELAKTDGADYVSVGPIWDTPSKPGRAGIGFDYLAKASALNLPYVAIGGINLSNINQILQFNPPLIGAIRSTKSIDSLWNLIKNSKK